MSKIKICGLTRPCDIDFVNEAKPDFCGFISNLRSRFVIIPTSFLPSVIGTPEIRNLPISSSASFNVCSGDK